MNIFKLNVTIDHEIRTVPCLCSGSCCSSGRAAISSMNCNPIRCQETREVVRIYNSHIDFP